MTQETPSIKSAEYSPLVIRKDGRFCLYLPEWRLSGEGDTLEEAYQQLEANVKIFEERHAKFGLASLTPEPYPAFRRRTVLRELMLSFGKAAAVASAVVFIVILLLPNIGAAFRNQAKTLIPAELKEPGFWAFQFPSKVNGTLDRLQPAEAEQMNREWGRLFERAAPLLKPLMCAPQDAVNLSPSLKK